MDTNIKFITGYLIELSLSIDNIFVIAVIFSSFGIPQKYQHRILFWGILGAIVFRALMILFGIMLIKKFRFKYHTHSHINNKGKTFNYIYDIAWMEFSDDEILIVKKDNTSK